MIHLTSIEQSQGSAVDAHYWNDQYLAHQTGWDIHQVSPPLKNYIDQYTDKHARILIPGCGNAHEADYLLQRGFTNIHLLDIAPALVATLQQRLEGNPHIQVILADFFTHQGTYDLILEQTFFCALHPSLRADYVQNMHRLLADKGKLVGVLFDKHFEKHGPPFGGDQQEYDSLFSPYFSFHTFSPCDCSVEKRKGEELFINFRKK